MDTQTGKIYSPEQMKEIEESIKEGAIEKDRFKEMKLAPTQEQLHRDPPRVGRNEPCPCGSGKKFKKCCLTTEKR